MNIFQLVIDFLSMLFAMTLLTILIIVALIWYIWKIKKDHKADQQPIVFRITTEVREPQQPEVEKDAWEGWADEVYEPSARRLPGLRLNIHFTDKEGQQTVRDITTERFSYNREMKTGLLLAFCHLRNSRRPFALSRISKPIDLETGEVIPNLGEFLEEAYQQTPLYQVDQFLEQHDAGAFILFSFAKADGALRAKERAIILNWAQANSLTDTQAQVELETQIRNWFMTKHSYWDTVKKIKQQGHSEDYMKTLWTALVAIIQSDKKPHDQEAEFLRYAAKQWGIAPADMPVLPAANK